MSLVRAFKAIVNKNIFNKEKKKENKTTPQIMKIKFQINKLFFLIPNA